MTAPCISCGKAVQINAGSDPTMPRTCRACRPPVEHPLCTGGCGKVMISCPTSAAPGERMCFPCRRAAHGLGADERIVRGRTCEICGGTYDATYAGQRTCSRACGWELRQREGTTPKTLAERGYAKAVPVYHGECRLCGRWFASPHRGRLHYCGDHTADDRKRDNWQRHNARVSERLPVFERTCLHCGAEFTTRSPLKIYCTEQHAKRARKRDRNRARRAGVAYTYVSRAKVYARDHWMCGLCGCKVDRMVAYPDDMCASLDHIIPMSRGGPHAYDNVQLAHLRCNIDKGADVDVMID